MTIEQRLELVSSYVCSQLKLNAPYDTGNLAINSIRREINSFDILIGGELAPYAVATNEAWDSNAAINYFLEYEPEMIFLKNLKNPNENWINNTLDKCLNTIRTIMSGEYTEEDLINVANLTIRNNQLFREKQLAMAALRDNIAKELRRSK